jgi:hypothetical protein
MKISELIKENASAGSTGSGAIATTPTSKGKKKKEVGTLFGGSYKQANESQKNTILKR